MKYLLLTLLFVSSCATKTELAKLEGKINNISIKESCTRHSLELLIFAPIATNPAYFANEGDFMQAQFELVEMKNRHEESCKALTELLKNESKN